MSPEDVVAPLRALTGREPVEWRPMDVGAYSPAGRWVVRWLDGGTAFVKAEAKPHDVYGLRAEHLVYTSVVADCLPRLYAYDAGPPRLLVTEDLSHARWGTPVTGEDTAALAAAFDALADVTPPEGLRPLPEERLWPGLLADPTAFLASGLADAAWAERHLPTLAEAEAAADPTGEHLLHGDLWLQNWCRTERGVVLVDWAGACVGAPVAMRAFAEGAVRAAGGPPGRLLTGRPEWAAWMAGQTAFHVSREITIPGLLETERREAWACLRWACEELGLPEPVPGQVIRDLGPWRP